MQTNTPLILLAPMEGVIDHTMRDLLTRMGGIDRCVTEFLRVSQGLLPPRVFYRICPELSRDGTTPAGVPVFLQLLGGNATLLAENAARGAELGARGIDLNFGCPAKTVNKSDGGSIILREPERVHAIVAAVRNSVPRNIPLSVKIRLGFENADQFLDIVSAIDAAAPSQLIIHARTRADGYRPPAYWSKIAEARTRTNLPLVANGEIWSVEDAQRARQASQTKELMLGRGVLCRPDLPRLLRAADSAQECQVLQWVSVRDLVTTYLDLTLENYDERYAVNPIKQWLGYLRYYYPQAAMLFNKIKRLKGSSELREAIVDDARLSHSNSALAAA